MGPSSFDVTATNAFGSTTQSYSVTIEPASTSTALASSRITAVLGQTVTFTATVSSGATGVPGPSGLVRFTIDGNPAGSPVTLVNGVTAFTTNTLAPGAHAVVATYAGAADYNGSTSATIDQMVGSRVAVVAPPTKTSSNAGATVNLRFALTDVNGVAIPDAEAAALGGACRVSGSGAGAQALATTCATYDPSADRFTVSWKTDKNHPGLVTVSFTVAYPGTTATTVGTLALTLT